MRLVLGYCRFIALDTIVENRFALGTQLREFLVVSRRRSRGRGRGPCAMVYLVVSLNVWWVVGTSPGADVLRSSPWTLANARDPVPDRVSRSASAPS